MALPQSPDIASFSHFVWLWNHHQGVGTPGLHLELAEWLDHRWHACDRQLVLSVFRNAGKSTLVGLFAGWLLCQDPNLRIMVVSAEQALAIKMTRNIRQIVENHPSSAHLRNLVSQEWAADRLTVNRDKILRDPSVLARGLSGNLTGSRADIIICDDIEVPNTCDTPTKRTDLRKRLKELDFVITPNGTQLFVGTPHNYYSIYSSNIEPDSGESAPFLDGYVKKTVAVVDNSGASRWPERFNVAALNQMAQKVGPQQYRSQMMLEPTHHKAVRLDPDQLRPYRGEIDITRRNGIPRLTIGGIEMAGSACWWDPAYGSPEDGDSSVVSCVFTDHQGQYWLHDIAYLTFDPNLLQLRDEASQLCDQVTDFAIRNEQPCVTIENNGIGRFLPGLLRRSAQVKQAAFTIQEQSATTSKVRRILEAFDSILAAGHLFVHERVFDTPFALEMREWRADGKSRDDGLDAVAGCLRSQPVRLDRIHGNARQRKWFGAGRSFRANTAFSI